VHRAARKTALQYGIGFIMTKRRPARPYTGALGFDPRDPIAQARKHPCAGHAPLS
jgi:hypothetical protein